MTQAEQVFFRHILTGCIYFLLYWLRFKDSITQPKKVDPARNPVKIESKVPKKQYEAFSELSFDTIDLCSTISTN